MQIKALPEDFVVEEIPAYEPCGEGEHLYVRFTKRGLTTDEAVRTVAKALKANPREAGVAGLKDRVGVTTQTVSFFLPKKLHPDADATALQLQLDGITLISAVRHGNKIKTGHLHGNRFDVLVRDVADHEMTALQASFDRIRADGVPNAYGEQRFGRDQQNASQARAWLKGEGLAPKDPRARRFLFSALQSEAFNHVLARRVKERTWNRCIRGDLLQKADSGGLFLCEDVEKDLPRCVSGEVSPTGPMFGPKMRETEADAHVIEEESKRECIGDIDWTLARGLGDGTRRALRLWVSDLRFFTEQAGSLRVHFMLPKGAYATTVISSAISSAIAAIKQT
ncbi:MAG: tRNA pseudouridine(13) synthase TruD [Polyangiaceae bacterium]